MHGSTARNAAAGDGQATQNATASTKSNSNSNGSRLQGQRQLTQSNIVHSDAPVQDYASGTDEGDSPNYTANGRT